MSLSKTNQESLIDDTTFNWETGIFEAPTSSTGALVVSQGFHLSLGWLTFSFKVDNPVYLDDAVDLVKNCYLSHLQDDVVDNRLSFRGYKQAIKFGFSPILAFTPGRTDFVLVMPQSFTERINIPYLLVLIADLLSFSGAKVTRLDLTMDDLKRLLAISEIYEACQQGCMVARTKHFEYSVGFNAPGELSKEILTIGKRTSNFYVRIYDKFLESKGKIDAVRVEAELKGKLADNFARLLLSSSVDQTDKKNPIQDFSVTGFAKSVLGLMRSKLDFRDVASHSNINRRSVLPFWDEFLHQAEKIKVIIPRKKITLESTKVWIEQKVAVVLSMLSIYLGSDTDAFINNLLSEGRSRLGKRHYALLREAFT